MPFIRSISGIRATVSDSLPSEIVAKYASAFARFLPPGNIIIGRDGRPSGVWIERLIAETLALNGRNVTILGVVPTPTIQLLVEHTSTASGGISITASHNPSEWNGMKFMFSDGVFLDTEQNNHLWEIADASHVSFDQTTTGEISYDNEAIEKHIDTILSLPLFTETILTILKNRKLRVVVDAVNASGSVIVPKLLEGLGCTVIPLFCNESGIFPHTPEPIPQNLTQLAAAVHHEKADLGIAVDPDADRLVLIDEHGHSIGEEKTIVLAAQCVLENHKLFGKYSPDIAVNLSTSRMINDIATRYNATVWRSAVGEVNVVRMMQHHNCIFGGEGSGGVILPSCHYGRDSLVGIALILHLIATNQATLSELSRSIPSYEMIKTRIDFNGDFGALSEILRQNFQEASVNNSDGVRFDFEDSWVHVRASNTEPIVRIIAEATTKERAEYLINQTLSFF
ncbi:MAG: phosphoglucosamine mutase [Ignavibacteria bacterium]|nr:phosphoglucosamine mutase [Ignavibacteria bacterium]